MKITRLKGNSLACIAFHPFYGIPFTLYYFYLGLYMKEFGVTDAQLGIIVMVGSVASVFFSFFAAPIVDRMGRKPATFWFDLLASALPPLLYFISGSFLMCLVAMIAFNTNKIMSVSYYLIMTEDADDDERVVAFNLFNIITVVSGAFIPVAGYYVKRYGLVGTERVFLFVAFVCMVGLIIARNRFIRETRYGTEIKNRLKGKAFSLSELVLPYKKSLEYLSGNHNAIMALAANVIFYVFFIIGTNNSLYFAPYFSDVLKLNAVNFSVLGAVYTAGMVIAMISVNPALQKMNIFRSLLLGGAVNTLGTLLLYFCPGGSFAFAIVATAVSGFGIGIFKSFIDAVFVITTEGEARSGLYSIMNILSSVLGIGVSLLLSIVYPLWPRSLYLICSGLLAVTLLCFARCLKKQ